jgi:hypothetical protein
MIEYNDLFIIFTKVQDEWQHKPFMPKIGDFYAINFSKIDENTNRNPVFSTLEEFENSSISHKDSNLLVFKLLNLSDLKEGITNLNAINTILERIWMNLDKNKLNLYILHHVMSDGLKRHDLNNDLISLINESLAKDQYHIHPYTVGSAGDADTFTSTYLFQELRFEELDSYLSVLKDRLKVNEDKLAIEKEYNLLCGANSNYTIMTYEFKK